MSGSQHRHLTERFFRVTGGYSVWVVYAMKRCPKCQQSVEASSLNFCRADGTLLVGDSFIEAATLLRNVGPSSPGTTKPLTEPTSSLAVLPFRNLTADPADEYFCVGF